MHSIQWFILIISSLAAAACALPGTFLVLRGISLMSDALSHAVLPGIVFTFFLVGRLNSPWHIVGAGIAGMLTALCIELVINSQKLKKDAAIGLIFPFFFSIGVLLISIYARDVHLDTDMVLLGDVALAPFTEVIYNGVSLGPYALWCVGAVFFINLCIITLFYKELVLATFDPLCAHIAQFRPRVLHYILMLLTSITAVSCFDIVGSIVVVALMIAPPATAYLVSDRVPDMLCGGVACGVLAACCGYWCAYWADVSIAGSIATITGIFFLLALFLAPRNGICARIVHQRSAQKILAARALCHLLKKNGPSSFCDIAQHLSWPKPYCTRIIGYALHKKWIVCSNSIYTVRD